jgi:hypothetical protein
MASPFRTFDELARAPRVSLAAIREAAWRDGYVAVRTLGGPLPLDAWEPYGTLPDDYCARLRFAYDSEAGYVYDVPMDGEPFPSHPVAGGAWPLVRQEKEGAP